MLNRKQDAFGRALLDSQQGGRPRLAFERDDGYIDCSGGTDGYFAPYREWDPAEKRALRYVRGRVLDVGCGAGRHCLYLQQQGHDVVGIDNSPLALKVCRQRGVRRTLALALSELSSRRLRSLGGRFDSVLMMNNNFGLCGSPQRARRMLHRFLGITNPDARIIASTRDPYASKRPEHTSYHRRNRKRGRLGGQARIRVRYQNYSTPWFDLLLASVKELRGILDSTGWELARTMPQRDGCYIAVIERTEEMIAGRSSR